MSKIFVHLGMHKCGTTAVQVAFSRRRDRLLRDGLLYPLAARPPAARHGHHSLAAAFITSEARLPDARWIGGGVTREQDREALCEALKTEIAGSGCETVVLSSEEFSVLSDQEIAAFGQAFAEFELVPVLYLRSFADYVESRFKTVALHTGFTGDVEAYLGGGRVRLDVSGIVDAWRTQENVGDVKILLYDMVSKGDGVVPGFRRLVGLSESLGGNGGAERHNPSMPTLLTPIISCLRRSGASQDEVNRVVAKVAAKLPASFRDRHTILDGALRARLDAAFLGELRTLALGGQISSQERDAVAATIAGRSGEYLSGPGQAMAALLDALESGGRRWPRWLRWLR